MTEQLLHDVILKEKLLSEQEFDRAKREAAEKNVSVAEHLVEGHFVTEAILYESLSHALNVPFIDLRNQIIRRDILSLIPEPIAQVHSIVAFDRDDEGVKIATLDPDDLQTIEFLEKKLNAPIRVHLTTPTSVKEVLKQFHKGLKAEFRDLAKGDDGKGATKDLKELAEDLPVIRIVDTLLEYAIFENASDIHIEPTEKDTIVRYRIDGVLREVMTLPKSVQSGVTARIKILSNLKIDEHRLPQDGRFKTATEEQKVAFRVSILPVFDGEKIVLRLLNESAQVLTLEQLGLQKGAMEILERNIRKPHGMILVTGPTGSGKTTTLYTILNVLNTPEVNISTVEDPIEYRMPRVNQTQVSPKIGLTFAGGLRALLRQDPNIIMVGEIRDEETAEISTHAALTGHLVLSTLHTNDAVTTLPRLTEMHVPTFLIASTTNLVMAQRLVRKICSNCIESYTLTKKQISDLEKQIHFSEILSTLQKIEVIAKDQAAETLLFYRGKGCKQCNLSGYRGRVGIYEVLEVTPPIAQLILDNASAAKLMAAALAQGMVTMLQDGFVKAKTGTTTIEEVLRVTKE